MTQTHKHGIPSSPGTFGSKLPLGKHMRKPPYSEGGLHGTQASLKELMSMRRLGIVRALRLIGYSKRYIRVLLIELYRVIGEFSRKQAVAYLKSLDSLLVWRKTSGLWVNLGR